MPPSEENRPLLSVQDCTVPHYDTLDVDPNFDDRKRLERNLLWKLDVRMSILLLIYIFSYMDRNSTAAARLRGFEHDLGLEGSQFASVLSVFYIGYVLMQIPSNMFLSHVGKPSIYLPFCMVLWGIAQFCIGSTETYHGALIARFLLGFVEATFYPGALYLIVKWYKRCELSQRLTFFACGSLISNAFGPLIASGILSSTDGILGYTAWRWLFFVEGGLTILVAIFALFILPDFPEAKTISWLTPAEHALAKRRMDEDAATSTSPQSPLDDFDQSPKQSEGAVAGLMLAVSDWKVWYMATMKLIILIALSFHIYFPTLTATMGYNTTISLLLCAPPWIVATFWSLWLSRHSDKTGERCMHIVTPFMIGLGGFVLAMSTMNTGFRYISLFLMAQAKAGAMCLTAWESSTVSKPPAKRAVALAFINTVSHGGTVLGSYVWVKEWGPTYNKSYAICSVTSLVCIGMCLWLSMALKRLNLEMDREDEQSREDVRSLSVPRWRYHT